MNVLIINGSPRNDGNCQVLVNELTKIFNEFNVNVDEVKLGSKNIRGCIACNKCKEIGECVFKDFVNETQPKLYKADGVIIVSPVYFASPNGSLISFLDRLFYSRNQSLNFKVGAAFAVARRGGTTASFDVLNKYFTISGMPICSGDYWNNGFGREKGEILEDKEGLRNARVVAKRMVFLMQAIIDAKSKYPDLLTDEERVWTHFIKNK